MRWWLGFSFEITDPTGRKISVRGLSYYDLADGKIVEEDAITTPEFAQAFADRMPPPSSD